jgi:hypothetical protein
LTCFTGEKFVTGQERFAPWYVYHKRIATHPVTNFSRPSVRLTGRAPRRMKQFNIGDPWYQVAKKQK